MNDPISRAHDQWVQQGWGEAADGMSVVLELFRVQRLLIERVDGALQPFALSFARYEVLMRLAVGRRDAMSIGDLGRLLQVHATSVTSMVDRLERDGLVGRIKLEKDRRLVLVRITAEGRRIAGAATEALNDSVYSSLGLSTQQVDRLWRSLRALRANAGDFDVISDRVARPSG